jgi:hypothetical protein
MFFQRWEGNPKGKHISPAAFVFFAQLVWIKVPGQLCQRHIAVILHLVQYLQSYYPALLNTLSEKIHQISSTPFLPRSLH